MSHFSPSHLEHAIPYPEYRKMIDALMGQNKTTGENYSEDYLNYTKLNIQRMKRLDKTTQLNSDLKELLKKAPTMKWVVLSEAWCGDAAQNIPVLHQMELESGGKISMHIVLRDENLDLMDKYLTNGGRSIPKVIFLDADTHQELGTWGPRPAPVQEMVEENKKNPTMNYSQFSEVVQKWYAKDKTQTLQQEITQLLKQWVPSVAN